MEPTEGKKREARGETGCQVDVVQWQCPPSGRIGRGRLSRVGSVGVGYVLTLTRYIHSFPCVRIDREHQMMLVEVDISLAFHQDFDAFKQEWMKHCFSVEFVPNVWLQLGLFLHLKFELQ